VLEPNCLRPAPKPILVLLLPIVFKAPAFVPILVLLLPEIFAKPVFIPILIFELPETLFCAAWTPIFVLKFPIEFIFPAKFPILVLLVPLVIDKLGIIQSMISVKESKHCALSVTPDGNFDFVSLWPSRVF